MAEYAYVALNRDGKQKKGTLIADDEAQALKKIKKEGLTPMELREAGMLNKEINLSIGKKITPRDLSIFCRQFVSMINAGVTIVDALGMLGEQTENKTMAQAIHNTQIQIGKGRTMADSMAQQEGVFPDMMISMVRAGEASGKIDIAFERMSNFFENQARIKGMIKKAAIYPIIVCIVALAVVVVMLTVIIPSYSDMFASMGMELPAITKAMVTLSDFVIANWPIMLIVIVSVIVGLNVFKRTEQGQEVFGQIAIKAPIFGDMNVKTASSLFAQTLSTLIYSGLTMNEALGITADTMSNIHYKRALLEAQKQVERGVQLSEPMKECGLFPPMVVHMIGIGEETGDLEGMLSKLSEYYDEEVQLATQSIMAAVEPMIIMMLAGIVVLLIATIMSPMIQMYAGMDNL